jgi:hypothetical protein
MLPTGARCSRSFADKTTAEAWITAERRLLDRGDWTTPKPEPTLRPPVNKPRREQAAPRTPVTCYLAEHDLRPNTLRSYRQLLDGARPSDDQAEPARRHDRALSPTWSGAC